MSSTPDSMPERNIAIRELRHQLRYTNPGAEREAIQAQITFWRRYRPTQEL